MDDITQIKIMIARIEERQIAADERGEAALEAANHRHRNTAMSIEGLAKKMDSFVPRAEIEANARAHEDRIDKIEANINKAAWGIIGAWICGIGVVVTGVRSKMGV